MLQPFGAYTGLYII